MPGRCTSRFRFFLPVSLSNLGPNIAYTHTSSGESDPIPRMLRLGLAYYPVKNNLVKVGITPEVSKIIVGMFYDTTGTKPFSRKLSEELRDAWKSFGVEASLANLLHARVGYFEDLTGQRGGIVLENESGQTYHYGLGDVMTGRDLGKLKSFGLCWGLGIGWKDYLRLDVSSDAAIYDFSTSNLQVSLVANDVAGLASEIGQLLSRPPRSMPHSAYDPGPSETWYTGSGVLLTKTGLLATCHHVIDSATQIWVDFPQRATSYPARVVADDAAHDLALLRLVRAADDSMDAPFALLQPEELRLGMETFTVGYPLTDIIGISPRYTAGSVSAMVGVDNDPRVLQIQNPVQPGNSGGPLSSREGRLMGIVVARLSKWRVLSRTGTLPENVNFAVKIGYLRALLAETEDGRSAMGRSSSIKPGPPEDIVQQILPYIGYVRVKAAR